MIDNFCQISSRVLESVHSSIILCDATKSENPIVALNSAFEELTGFDRDEILGRSCSFLQKDDVDQPEINDIRLAIKEQRSMQCVLRNYHKDGSLFYNSLSIDPIRNEMGVVTHFVGCQNAIDQAHTAYVKTLALDRFRQLSPREREVFELLAGGHSNKAVAGLLDISIRTAEKHRLIVMKKMEAQNLTQIVRYSIALSA